MSKISFVEGGYESDWQRRGGFCLPFDEAKRVSNMSARNREQEILGDEILLAYVGEEIAVEIVGEFFDGNKLGDDSH